MPRSDYDDLITQLEVGIEQATDKLEAGRIKDVEREEIRVKYLRELVDLSNTKLNVIRARDGP